MNKLAIKNVTVKTSFDGDFGAEARLFGEYNGKPIHIFTQGGRDEDGNFERIACPDCWTAVEYNGETIIDEEDAQNRGTSNLSEILGITEEYCGEAWAAIDELLEEKLGEKRYWEFGQDLDRYNK